jgi:hypothetical protein
MKRIAGIGKGILSTATVGMLALTGFVDLAEDLRRPSEAEETVREEKVGG